MKANKAITTYQRLRTQPLWRLLAADHGPIIIGLLQTHLFENQRSLPASIFFERLSRDLEELRGRGEDIPQTAQAYVADWLAKGYLERRFPVGATEEEYELSSAAASAIRYVLGLVEPRSAATESRLATVIHQLIRLSEETETNPETRIAALVAERERIDREISAIQRGKLVALPDARALERVREIIALTDELIGDFRQVRDEFESLNRDLRLRIMNNEDNRGEVLSALFAGVDVISQSDAGLSFSAFWRLLTDPEQGASLEDALEKVMSRPFSTQLDARERRFLTRLTGTLLEQSGSVHKVLQHFARSLKHFVQSREYLEQKRLNQLFKDAQQAAIAIKDERKINNLLSYPLVLSSSRLRSLSQWSLHDPATRLIKVGVSEGEALSVNLQAISELVAQSEINFRGLKSNILALFQTQSPISIADLLNQFPAHQGLGTVVGYLALGSRHGQRTNDYESIGWSGSDKRRRRARIPLIYFLKEKAHEFA